MRVKWAVLLSSASLLLGSTSVPAQDPLALSGAQLDGVVPTYQYDPSRYQVRVAIEPVVVADPDRVRNALLMIEDPEANMAAQQIPGEEPQCTPARRALLAIAGRSESFTEDAAAQQGRPLAISASPSRQTAGAAEPRPRQLLTAADSDPAVIGTASRPQSISTLASGGGRATSGDTGSSWRQRVTGSSPSGKSSGAGVTSKRVPAAAAANGAAKVEVPTRTTRSEGPSRPAGSNAARLGAGAHAGDIVARVKSDVNRTLSALPGGALRLN